MPSRAILVAQSQGDKRHGKTIWRANEGRTRDSVHGGAWDVGSGDRCFAAVGPWLWNTLPIYLKQCHSLEQFKRLLKTFLFSA